MKPLVKTYLLLSFLLFSHISLSQSNSKPASIKGHVKANDGSAIPGVIVSLKNQSHGTQTDEHGFYHLQDIPPGNYLLLFSTVGYYNDSLAVSLKENEHKKLDRHLQNDSTSAIEVTVISKSEAQKIKESEFNVNVVDASKFANRSSDLNHVLNYVSGVRIRENGGVGSNFNFSLNGFTGRQVRFFIDGLPMDNFGSSFQLNNIPINLAERIEIYKGVIPIWLGADALGGAINVVTSTKARTYIDASYSYGSFNTHRTVINGGYTSKSGFTVQLNAFQNYSDNNYWVKVANADLNTGLYDTIRVRRFHDTYRNETVIANVGVVGKKYADKLLVGITLGQNRADIQTGASMENGVFGNYFRHGNIIMPSIKYQKNNLLLQGLNLSFSANYNIGQEEVVDTVFRKYNWRGDYIDFSDKGPGSERSRTLYRFRNNVGVSTTNLSYQINEKHSLMFNYVYNTFNRKGEDRLSPGNIANKQPRMTNKSVIALGYKFDFNRRWSTSLFAKQYIQVNRSSENKATAYGVTNYVIERSVFRATGYGIASTFFVLPKLQVKGSFEVGYRLPENEELYGDAVNQLGNNQLKPESSSNVNFGVSYTPTIRQNHQFLFDASILYRETKDYIRPTLAPNGDKTIMINEGMVNNTGFNGEIRYSYKRLFSLGANATYQNLVNNTKYVNGKSNVSELYLDRLPNIPFLFGNADASITLNKVGDKRNRLTLSYNYMYVHAYYLRWPSQGTKGTKFDIPKQVSHDLTLMYSMADGRYNLTLECRNVTDAMLYDNFRLQKAGRAFYVKFRYYFSKQTK